MTCRRGRVNDARERSARELLAGTALFVPRGGAVVRDRSHDVRGDAACTLEIARHVIKPLAT